MPSIDHCTNIRIGIVAYMIHDIWLLAYKSKMWKKYTVPFVLDFDSLSQWPFFLRYTIPSKCSQVAVFYQKMSLLRTTDTWGWEKLILFTNRLPYTAVCARLFPHTHHTTHTYPSILTFVVLWKFRIPHSCYWFWLYALDRTFRIDSIGRVCFFPLSLVDGLRGEWLLVCALFMRGPFCRCYEA